MVLIAAVLKFLHKKYKTMDERIMYKDTILKVSTQATLFCNNKMIQAWFHACLILIIKMSIWELKILSTLFSTDRTILLFLLQCTVRIDSLYSRLVQQLKSWFIPQKSTLAARGFLREEPQSAISEAVKREKIDKRWENLWLPATVDWSYRANRFELGARSDPASWLEEPYRCVTIGWLLIDLLMLIDSYRSMIVRYTLWVTWGFLLPLRSLSLLSLCGERKPLGTTNLSMTRAWNCDQLVANVTKKWVLATRILELVASRRLGFSLLNFFYF